MAANPISIDITMIKILVFFFMIGKYICLLFTFLVASIQIQLLTEGIYCVTSFGEVKSNWTRSAILNNEAVMVGITASQI
jgi:hypothetical protein